MCSSDLEIDIRSFVGSSARSRSAEHDRLNAVYLRDAADDLTEYFFDSALIRHPPSLGCAALFSNVAEPNP